MASGTVAVVPTTVVATTVHPAVVKYTDNTVLTDNVSANWFLFIFLFVMLAACLIVFIILLALKPKRHVKIVAPEVFPTHWAQDPGGFEQSYLQTNGPAGINVLTDNKPFSIVAARDGIAKPLFTFLARTPPGPLSTETTPTSRGFTFGVSQPISVVGVQVIDSLFASGTRQVGLFNVTQGQVVFIASVDKATGNVRDGFCTNVLPGATNSYLLSPNVLYACVALVMPGDSYVTQPAWCNPAAEVLMDNASDTSNLGVGKTGFVPSASLTLPTNFSVKSLSSPFASFLLQQLDTTTTVFRVDTQYGTFPPNYIYGCLFESIDANSWLMNTGFCTSAYSLENLTVQKPIDLNIGLGILKPNSIYAVFVVQQLDPTPQSSAATVLFAQTYSDPPGLAAGVRWRRTAWILTNAAAGGFLMRQSGNGISRTNWLLEQAQLSQIAGVVNGASGTIPLDLVPKTASEATFELEIKWQTFTGGDVTVTFNGGTHSVFYPSGTVLQHVTLPLGVFNSLSWTAAIGFTVAPPPTFIFRLISFLEDL